MWHAKCTFHSMCRKWRVSCGVFQAKSPSIYDLKDILRCVMFRCRKFGSWCKMHFISWRFGAFDFSWNGQFIHHFAFVRSNSSILFASVRHKWECNKCIHIYILNGTLAVVVDKIIQSWICIFTKSHNTFWKSICRNYLL